MTQISGTLGLVSEQVAELLAVAGRAPSLHNSQPWRFHLTPHRIELHSDPERSLRVADPDGRELRMACGAALFNLRLALHSHGIRPIVTLHPERDRPDLLAVVRHGGAKNFTPEQDRLLRAIPRWRTNRHPFSDTEVDSSEQHALRRAALDEGAWLHVVHDRTQREALRAMVARAHRMPTSDPAYRAELAAWSTVAPERRDGVPGRDPLIAVLTSHLNGPTAEVQVGQALQRVLLTATAAGLDVSFLSQVVEVASTRRELRSLIGGTQPPQAVLRIGYGSGTTAVTLVPEPGRLTTRSDPPTSSARSVIDRMP